MEDIIEVNLEVNFLPYLLIILVVTALIVASLFYFKSINSSSKKNPYEKLKSINFNSSSKEIAYSFTIYTKELNLNDNKLKEILDELNEFKYKKESKKMPRELILKMQEYIKGLEIE